VGHSFLERCQPVSLAKRSRGCRAASDGLAMRTVATQDVPHPTAELGAVAAVHQHVVTRSVLGPHGIGNCRFPTGTSGQDKCEETARHHAFTPRTSAVEARCRLLRIPPPLRFWSFLKLTRSGGATVFLKPTQRLLHLVPRLGCRSHCQMVRACIYYRNAEG